MLAFCHTLRLNLTQLCSKLLDQSINQKQQGNPSTKNISLPIGLASNNGWWASKACSRTPILKHSTPLSNSKFLNGCSTLPSGRPIVLNKFTVKGLMYVRADGERLVFWSCRGCYCRVFLRRKNLAASQSVRLRGGVFSLVDLIGQTTRWCGVQCLCIFTPLF